MQHLLPATFSDARLAELREGLEIIALRRLGDLEDARDAAQECVVRLLDRLQRGPPLPADEIAPVAHGIAKHVIADVLRARQRVVTLGSDTPEQDADALEQLVGAEERAALALALASLDPDDRELLRRCFVDGERIGSIARALGEPAPRLRKRKSRALARLREVLFRASSNGHAFARDAMRAS